MVRITTYICVFWMLVIAWQAKGEVSEPTQDLIKEAIKQIGQFESGDFDEREKALKKMKALDRSILPWLKKQLASQRPEIPLSDEARGRLSQVVTAMEAKVASELRVEGTPVVIKRAGMGPKEFLQELERQSHNALPQDFWERLSGQAPATFDVTGNYWKALDDLMAAYPPKTEGKWRREDLSSPRPANVWGEGEYNGWNAPHANAGICRVRVARVSLERDHAGQALSIVLAPVVEPRIWTERLDVSVDVFKLEGGREVVAKWAFEPNKKDRVGVCGPQFGDKLIAITPMSDCCYVVNAKDIKAGDRTFSIEGVVSLTLREPICVVNPLRKWDRPWTAPDGSTIQIRGKALNQYEVTIAGGKAETLRANGTVGNLRFLNEKGDPVEAQLRTSNAQYSNMGYSLTHTYEVVTPFSTIEYTALKAPYDIEIPFKIEKIPLPSRGE